MPHIPAMMPPECMICVRTAWRLVELRTRSLLRELVLHFFGTCTSVQAALCALHACTSDGGTRSFFQLGVFTSVVLLWTTDT